MRARCSYSCRTQLLKIKFTLQRIWVCSARFSFPRDSSCSQATCEEIDLHYTITEHTLAYPVCRSFACRTASQAMRDDDASARKYSFELGESSSIIGPFQLIHAVVARGPVAARGPATATDSGPGRAPAAAQRHSVDHRRAGAFRVPERKCVIFLEWLFVSSLYSF